MIFYIIAPLAPINTKHLHQAGFLEAIWNTAPWPAAGADDGADIDYSAELIPYEEEMKRNKGKHKALMEDLGSKKLKSHTSVAFPSRGSFRGKAPRPQQVGRRSSIRASVVGEYEGLLGQLATVCVHGEVNGGSEVGGFDCFYAPCVAATSRGGRLQLDILHESKTPRALQFGYEINAVRSRSSAHVLESKTPPHSLLSLFFNRAPCGEELLSA